MSSPLDVPRRQGSPTTIRSSGCEAPSYQNWPLYDGQNAHFISPTDHYFKTGVYVPHDAPFDFDQRSGGYMNEKSEHYEHFPDELPEKPPRTFFRNVPFIPGYEIPIRPHIIRTRRKIKNPIPLSWQAGFERLYASWVDNWWLWELLSWVISALCMGIIALILLLSDNRPVGSNDVTLNSIISVLSGVAKAALLLPTAEALGQLKWSWFWRDTKKVEDFEAFDSASRGPWGSLMLLLKTKGQTLAAFGAIITIVSIALDPFFQQLVVFPQVWVPASFSNTTTRFPQAITWQGMMPNETYGGEQTMQPDPVMRAFVDPIFFGNTLEPTIPLYCPTSNCTWEAYDTLSVCSACEDVSSLLQYACVETAVDWFSNVTQVGNTTQYPNATTCGYYLNASSENPLLMSGYVPSADFNNPEEALIGRIFPLLDFTTTETFWDGSINFKDRINPILDVLISNSPSGLGGVYANETPVAHECVLSWCTRRFRMSYDLGDVTQEEVSPPFDTNASIVQPLTMTMESYGPNYDYEPNFRFAPPGSDQTFFVSNTTAFQTILTFQEVVPLMVTGISNSKTLRQRFGNLPNYPAVVECDVSPWNGNITDRFTTLGKTMTNVILSAFTGTVPVYGDSWQREVYVNVRWKWLSLPFALLLLSLIFLLSTIFKSADEEKDIGIWKTSTLAVLVNGLRGDVHRKMGSSRQMSDIRARAHEVDVKLMSTKKGYRLSGMPSVGGATWTSSPEKDMRGSPWI